MKKAFGVIYLHRNKINGKCYVGKTEQKTKRRWRNTGTSISAYKNSIIFYNALKKYGWANFESTEIASCTNAKDLSWLEGYFMTYYNSVTPNGYNTLPISGDRVVYTPEVRAKISAAHKGKNKGKVLPKGMVTRKEHIFVDGVESKQCSRCPEIKPLADFSKDKNAKWDGLMGHCRECNRKLNKTYIRYIKLTPEQTAQSYIDRSSAMAAAVRAKFDNDPSYKAKLSKSMSKAIKAVHTVTGEVLRFDSALKAKEAGFQNSNLGVAIKKQKPYKGYMWYFDNSEVIEQKEAV